MMMKAQCITLNNRAWSTGWDRKYLSGGESQRRTLTGTGRKKTVPGSTGKNPRIAAASDAAKAIKLVGFFNISQME
jgi:hypothetical protein